MDTMDERDLIESLRTRVNNILTGNMYDDTLLFYRFLKARNFNVDEAEIMLRKHMIWRKLDQVDTILEDFKPAETGRNVYKMIMIMDLDKLTFANATQKASADGMLGISNLYQNNYPEYLKAVYVINAPIYAMIMVRILKAIMSNATIQKIHIFGNEGWKEKLLEEIDADVLPAFLGGNRTDPDGNPLCKTFVNHGGVFSPEYFLTDDERYFKNRPGVKKILVPKRDKQEIGFEVNEVGSVIRWEFYCKGSINFGLYRELLETNQEEVIPLTRYNTSDGTEKNSYKARIPGNYIIVFDNSFSWMTSKEVEYCIEVLKPES